MQDFNFFEFYRRKKAQTNMVFTLVFAVLIATLIGVVGLIAWDYATYIKYKKDIESIQAQLNDRSLKEKLIQVQEIEGKAENLRKQALVVDRLDLILQFNDTVKEHTLADITKEFTDNMFIRTMSIDGSIVTMEGSALDKAVIGKFESNLRNSGNYSAVYFQNSKVNEETKEEWMKILGYLHPQFTMAATIESRITPELVEKVLMTPSVTASENETQQDVSGDTATSKEKSEEKIQENKGQ